VRVEVIRWGIPGRESPGELRVGNSDSRNSPSNHKVKRCVYCFVGNSLVIRWVKGKILKYVMRSLPHLFPAFFHDNPAHPME